VLDVFICCSPADREAAAAIAARLQHGAEAEVSLEECDPEAGQTVASAWDGGLSSAAILLLLSPQAVPERLSRSHWESVLNHVEANATPPLGAVLVSDCPYPRLLERKRFFRWADDAQGALRAIERWALSLHSQPEQPSFVPAGLPWFQGRHHELNRMWEALVDAAGAIVLVNPAPGSGKTSLAQEFARVASGHFRDILWVACGDRTLTAIVSDLGSQLGLTLQGSAEEALARTSRVIQEHRLLVVFDDLTVEAPIVTSPEGRTSLLITARSGQIELPPHARIMRIESTIPPVLTEPPADSLDRRLWEAISVCRPHGFPLELAARIANIEESMARDACHRLVAQRWVDPFDAAGVRFRVGAGSLAAKQSAADYEVLRRRHAETLKEIFSDWRRRPARCEEFLAELEVAFQWALRSDWQLANELAERAFPFLKAQQRWPEAARICLQLLQAAGERRDSRVVENCAWELSWIQDEQGGIRRPPVVGDQLAFDWAADE